MKRILLFYLLCMGGLFLSGCHIIYLHLCDQATVKDISHEPRVEHLIGRWLELKQDVFLFQFPVTNTYALQVPGSSTDLPNSVAEYQRDPLNWQNTDMNAKQGLGPAQGYQKMKVIAVIPKGTKAYVCQIKERSTLYESFVKVYAYLDDPKYCNIPVNIYYLLKKEYGKVVIPYPEEPEKTTMGREIIPYPNPGLIEYCDE